MYVLLFVFQTHIFIHLIVKLSSRQLQHLACYIRRRCSFSFGKKWERRNNMCVTSFPTHVTKWPLRCCRHCIRCVFLFPLSLWYIENRIHALDLDFKMEARSFFAIASSSPYTQDISFIDQFYNAQLHPVIERKFHHISGVKSNLTFKEVKKLSEEFWWVVKATAQFRRRII